MVSLDFKNNGSWHNDIYFRIDAFVKTCDSYYFLIDRNYSEEENLDKTIAVIALLIDQWIGAIESLKNKHAVYLPYDFSDQYTGCLRVVRKDDAYELTPGYSNREGWLICPSDISDYIRTTSDFTSDGVSVLMKLDELIIHLKQSKNRIIEQEKL